MNKPGDTINTVTYTDAGTPTRHDLTILTVDDAGLVAFDAIDREFHVVTVDIDGEHDTDSTHNTLSAALDALNAVGVRYRSSA